MPWEVEHEERDTRMLTRLIAIKYVGTIQEQVAAARHIKFPASSRSYKELEQTCW